jgi:hypothetical protein
MKRKWTVDTIRLVDLDKDPIAGTADCQDGNSNCRIEFKYHHRSAQWNFKLDQNTDLETCVRLIKKFGIDREERDLDPRSTLCMQIVESVVEAHPHILLPQKPFDSPGEQICDSVNRFCERVQLDCRTGEVQSNFMSWREKQNSLQDYPDCFVATAYLFNPRHESCGFVRGIAYMTDRNHAEIIVTIDAELTLSRISRTNDYVDWGGNTSLPFSLFRAVASRITKVVNRF